MFRWPLSHIHRLPHLRLPSAMQDTPASSPIIGLYINGFYYRMKAAAISMTYTVTKIQISSRRSKSALK